MAASRRMGEEAPLGFRGSSDENPKMVPEEGLRNDWYCRINLKKTLYICYDSVFVVFLYIIHPFFRSCIRLRYECVLHPISVRMFCIQLQYECFAPDSCTNVLRLTPVQMIRSDFAQIDLMRIPVENIYS